MRCEEDLARELVSLARRVVGAGKKKATPERDDVAQMLLGSRWEKRLAQPAEEEAARLLPWGWIDVANVLAEGNAFELGERQIPIVSRIKGRELDLLNDNGIVLVRNPNRLQEILTRMGIK